MFSHFGNLGFLGGMQPHPFFGMQPQGMPAHYPGAFSQPSWGSSPQPIGGPMQFPMQQPMMPAQGTMQMQPQMPVQGTMQRYPLMSGMGRINLGALGQSQMMRAPQAY